MRLDDKAVEKRLTDLREMGSAYAQAKKQLTYLEEFKKSKLALLMKDAEKLGVTSAVAQERDARASDEYIKLIDGLAEAMHTATYLRWQMDVAVMGVDLIRTQESTKRAEMQLYGGDNVRKTVLNED